MRRALSLLTIAALAGGCGRPWPKTAVSAADPDLARRGFMTVDVLPVDLAVWAPPGTVSPDAVRGQLETSILSSALDALTKRTYGVDALIDWNGHADGRAVLDPGELEATLQALAGYGLAVPAGTPAIQPVLSTQLGAATGSDATLYVGGWAYVGKPRESTAEKVAKGVAIALLVVTAVVIVVAIADSLSDSKKGGKAKKGGAAVRDDREDVIAGVRDHRSGSSTSGAVVRDHRTSSSRAHRGTSAGALVRDHRGSSDAPAPFVLDRRSASMISARDHRSAAGNSWRPDAVPSATTSRGAADSASGGAPDPASGGAAGWSNARDHRTSAAWSGARDHRRGRGGPPLVRDHRGRQYALVRDHRAKRQAGIDLVYWDDGIIEDDIILAPRQIPPEPGESRLYLEMTLVDNHTGRVLWHAHQTFPANPTKPGDVERAARVLLASLPAH